MRHLWMVLGFMVAIGLCAGSASAEKVLEAKDWHYDLSGVREIVEEVEPNDQCPGQVIVCGDMVQPAYIIPADEQDWFQIYAAEGAVITVGTDEWDAPNDVYDTRLWVYADDCVTELAYDDDGGPGYYSLLSFEAPYSGDYNILVESYYGYYEGGYIMFTECSEPQEPPENDLCEGAFVIERCTTGVIEADLAWATNDYDPAIPGPSCTGYPAAGRDVTYVMDLVAGDMVDMFYYGGWDESFYIVTDCSDMTTCVIGADDTVGTGETIVWTALETGTYYVICDAYGTDAGSTFTLTYTIECPTASEETTWGQMKSRFR